MMYAEADVRMGEGGQPDADNSGQGGGGVKILIFCGRPLWTAPDHAYRSRDTGPQT